MKTKREGRSCRKKCETSRCWFMRFKERNCLYNIRVQGEAASADGEAAGNYPEDMAQITNENGYSEQQIFNVDKTTLY